MAVSSTYSCGARWEECGRDLTENHGGGDRAHWAAGEVSLSTRCTFGTIYEDKGKITRSRLAESVREKMLKSIRYTLIQNNSL